MTYVRAIGRIFFPAEPPNKQGLIKPVDPTGYGTGFMKTANYLGRKIIKTGANRDILTKLPKMEIRLHTASLFRAGERGLGFLNKEIIE